jgi:hypothetical protein
MIGMVILILVLIAIIVGGAWAVIKWMFSGGV